MAVHMKQSSGQVMTVWLPRGRGTRQPPLLLRAIRTVRKHGGPFEPAERWIFQGLVSEGKNHLAVQVGSTPQSDKEGRWDAVLVTPVTPAPTRESCGRWLSGLQPLVEQRGRPPVTQPHSAAARHLV